MFGRRGAASQAPNATVVPAAVYSPDPAGWGLFTRLTSANARYLTGQRAVVTPGTAAGGYVASPQAFRGLNLGHSAAVALTSSSLDQERSDQITDPAQRIFWQRLSQGRS